MKITELQDRLETLQLKLSIIHETSNAIEICLENNGLRADQLEFVMLGITESIKKAANEVEKLVNETIKMRATIDRL